MFGTYKIPVDTESDHVLPGMQGGCMAIEDGYQLALTLAERADQSKDKPMDIEAALRAYQSVRSTPSLWLCSAICISCTVSVDVHLKIFWTCGCLPRLYD